MAENYIVIVSGVGTVCVAESYEAAYPTWEWYTKLSKKEGKTVSYATVRLIDKYGDVVHSSAWEEERDE